MTSPEPLNLFTTEYEQELETWLRRRFRILCAIYLLGVIIDGAISVGVYGWSHGTNSFWGGFVVWAGLALSIAVILANLVAREWREANRIETLRGVSRMILTLGAISLAMKFTERSFGRDEDITLLGSLFIWHFTACLFLPWRPQESLQPFVPLFLAWAVIVLFLPGPDAGPLAQRVFNVLFGPGVLVPGFVICLWRMQMHSNRFRQKMIGQQFFWMREEYVRARSIHESMFPDEVRDGPIEFEYAYSPMRDLGGDFLFLHHDDTAGRMMVTLLDVTGHGLAAALTVNRLYGELERIHAETPGIAPGEVLRLLNRYVYLTLARHRVFVTGLCVEIDAETSCLRYASAGHPPAFLRRQDGVIRDLPATAVLLGAWDAERFTGGEEAIELNGGDVLIMYTDGAFETRDRQKEMLGLDRFRNLMRTHPAPRHWPQFLEAAVSKHTVGRAEDDVLIAAMTFVGSPTKTG